MSTSPIASSEKIQTALTNLGIPDGFIAYDTVPLLRQLVVALGNVTTAWAAQVTLGPGSAAIGGTKDNGPHWTPTRTYTAISSATTTDITVAPTSGQKIVLDDLIISADAAQTVSLVEETSGTVFAKFFIPANGTIQITPRDGLKAAVADKKLRVTTTSTANTSITACYHSEA